MKNLTQLPWSGKGSKAKNDNTLGLMQGGIRSRIGSMSLKNTSLFGVILTLLLTFGVGEMWGADASSANIYYDNTSSAWSDVQIFIGHSGWSVADAMTKLTNSNNLYYKRSYSWGGYSSFYFTTGASGWEGRSENVDTRVGYTTHYSAKMTNNLSNSTWLFVSSGSSNGSSVSASTITGYDKLNYTQTVQQTLSTDGGSTYSASTASLATVKVASYYLSSATATSATATSGTISAGNSSANCKAVRTATVTYTVSSVATGYTFVGWYDGSTQKSTSTSYTYNATEAKTITARFKENRYNVTAAASPAAGGSVTPTSATAMGQISGGSITASPNSGYTFDGWSVTSGSGSFGSSTSTAINTFKPTAASTVTATFNETMSTVSFVASPSGKGTFTVGGSTVTSTTAGVTTTKSVTAVPISGYRFTGWSITGGASISSTSTNPTTVTGGGAGTAATLTATFEEDLTYYKLRFGACSGETSRGTVAAEDGSGAPLTSNTDHLSGTSVTVTATATDDDYKFDSWYDAWTSGSSVSTDNPLTFTLSAATDRFAHFVKKTTSITLNKGIGSGGTTGPVTATHGSNTLSPTISVNPAKSGYTFTGYWTASSGGVKVIDTNGALIANVSGYTKSSNNKWDYDDATLDLYAQWEEKMTTVTINVSPASSGTLTLDAAAFTPGNTTTAGVTTSHSVVATAANDYTFSSWSVTGNATGTSSTNTYTLKGNGSAGTGTLAANFTLVPCNLYKLSAAKNGSTTDKGVMSYDATEHAYYKDITTDASPYYFRFYYNASEQYCSDWSSKAGGDAYSSGKQIPANDSKIDCDQSVGGWGDKPAMYFSGASGTTIRIWFDFQNKKTWITANKNEQYVLRGANADNSELLDGMPGWSATTSYFDGLASGNTGTYAPTLNADEWYHLKVYDVYNDIWYGTTGDEAELTDGVLGTMGSGNDFYFHTTGEGDYTFTLDKSSGTKIKIDYPVSYQVNFSANTIAGSNGQSSDPTATYNSGVTSVSNGGYVPGGTSVTFTAANAKTGYTWNGWYTVTSGGSAVSTNKSYTRTINAATTLYARYTQNTHTVTLTNANSTYGIVNTSSPVTVGEAEAVQIQATPKSGYMFNGWNVTSGSGITYHVGAGADQIEDGSGASKGTTYITTTANATLQATWDEDRSSGYVVRYGNDGKNADGGSDASQTRAWQDGTLYKKPGETTGTVSYFTFTAAAADVTKVIEFKIKDENTDTYYGYNAAGGGKIDASISNVTLNTSYGNGRMVIVTPGDYVFKWDSSTKKLSITYPAGNYLRGTFNSWGWGDPLEPTGNANEYACTVSLSAKQTWSAPDYGFKVVIGGVHYGKNGTAISRASNTASSLSTSGANIGMATDAAGDYTFTFNTSSKNLTVTYPDAYTVTFGMGTGGGTIGASATSAGGALTSGDYVAEGDDVTFTQTPSSSGYTFKGWYTTADGNTTVTGLSTSDYVLEDIAADANVYTQYTANPYTVSFNVNGGTAGTPDSKVVTFGSAYGELPGNMTHASKTFVGWFTDASAGKRVTADSIVDIAGNHTLYARYETTYEVTVKYMCGEDVLYPQTTVTASESALTPTIIAPVILGYSFVNWTGNNVSPVDASNDTTTITADAATDIIANYSVVPTVYFKNNLGWDSVFVTFDCSFIAGKQNVPSNNGHPYFAMTQLGSTDIFYCEIPDSIVANDYAKWKWNIAFDNTNYDGKATTDHIGTWDFYGGEFIGRSDFDPNATMYIPFNGDTEPRNSGTFYRTGCWMKYNSTESGYQVNLNTWINGAHADSLLVELKAPVAGSYEFSATVNLKSPNYGYGFKLYKLYQKNSNQLWYSNKGSIYSNTTDLPWEFATKIGDEEVTATTQRCELHTEALGDYKITVSFATGKPVVDVEYPASKGDWRLAYNDRVAWSGDTPHGESWYIYSRVIKAKADAEDIVSFYVSKAVGANAHIELQKCTNIDGSGNETWTPQGSDLDLSAITATGIYNFKVTQNGSKEASAAYDGSYSGNFYIRTDASDGGWTNYITSGKNLMTYSEYAAEQENSSFTHYFMRFITQGSNIKFCVANDYSPCLTEYCIDDDYTGEWIEANGNVRFMWDHRTNAVSRAYISGSSIVSDRFLVLEGDEKMFDENGNALTGTHQVSGLNANEMNFIDDQNWIYEATVKAKPGAKVKLTARYNNKIQYFYGDEGTTAADSVLLLGGDESSPNSYKIRVVYDFKTNRLIKAFIPDGEIGENLSIEADLMIIREAQEEAQQISFSGSSKLSEVKTVYGAMKFNKYTVNNKEKTGGHGGAGLSRYERDLFYISFPFDVKLSDAFGFGTYGKHWIIEYYDGKERAANGFWAETETFWKFVMPSQRSSFTMKANEGYILALDLDELTESSSVWNNGVEDVYVYFPSNGDIDNIYATEKTVTIDQTGYECTIGPRPGMSDDRRMKDSYWHVIGAPSFANYGSVLKDGKGGTTIDWSDDDGEIDWTTPSLPYLYEWNSADNSLSVTTSATFTFKAMYSYMVQYAGSSIYWSSVNAVVPSPVAPRKIDNAQADVEFRLELQQGEQNADQTFVRLTDEENVTTGYDFNYDLSKEMNGGKANIYTMITSVIDNEASVTEAAGNVLPMSEQTTVVPVGVKIATNGDYTFSIPEGTEGVGVTLIDTETGIRTSLSALDYTVSLEAGTYNDRFVIEISPIQHVATELETSDIRHQKSDVRKILIDGLLYIVRDGKMFDARGARVE